MRRSEPDTTADVIAARAGDRAAFARLARQQAPLIRLVVRDHVRTPEDVADCVQETLTRALQDLPRLREPERFRAWLRGIARHVAIDHRRRRTRDTLRTATLADGADGDETPCTGPGPEHQVARLLLATTLRHTARSLPQRDALALDLADYQDRCPREVAAALGVSTGNARVIVHRARRRLRDQLVAQLRTEAGLGCEDHGAPLPGGDPAAGTLATECPDCRTAVHQALLTPA